MNKDGYEIIVSSGRAGDFILICHDNIFSDTLKYAQEISHGIVVLDLKKVTMLEALRGVATDCVCGVYVLDHERDLETYIEEDYDLLASVETWGEFLDLFEDE